MAEYSPTNSSISGGIVRSVLREERRIYENVLANIRL